jgi:hypothetical protein
MVCSRGTLSLGLVGDLGGAVTPSFLPSSEGLDISLLSCVLCGFGCEWVMASEVK